MKSLSAFVCVLLIGTSANASGVQKGAHCVMNNAPYQVGTCWDAEWSGRQDGLKAGMRVEVVDMTSAIHPDPMCRDGREIEVLVREEVSLRQLDEGYVPRQSWVYTRYIDCP